ncbi:MAG: YggS family pyridoxal phosphate-dependent enzyme [Gammaproteobacteria bacterium]|nr:YggS family pyridoxal phosphate-dependent enzyme [Gammaproteobacteria bacterium]
MDDPLALHFQQTLARIEAAAAHCQRPAPLLLAVSKTQPAAAIRALFALGQRAFGESYWQEAQGKLAQLADLPIDWHFIGPLQANKTRPVAEHFAWAHGVEREKIARRLSEQRPPQLPPLNICLQVNLDGEASKAGVAPEDVLPLALAVKDLPNLKLRGLMCIPAPRADAAEQRAAFRRMAELLEQLRAAGIEGLDTLSMGMSDDLEAAIAEGSTLVRVGTAIFGERG